MADPDYYAELGVAREAGSDDIRSAFRKLAAQFHPDRHPGDKVAEAKFKKINEAYTVLDDPKSKAAYDRGDQRQIDAGPGFQGFNSPEDLFSRYGGVFGDLFGNGAPREAAREAGEDFEVELSIPFREAALGGKNSFAMTAPGACETCHGTGSADGRPHPCPACHGSGQVGRRAGQAFLMTPCPACQGLGVDPTAACPKCKGSRVETRSRSIEVTIPPAVAEGTVLRLRGLGAPGRGGGPPGDLRIRIRIQPGGPFGREGLHLKCDLVVDVLTAVLGGKAEVPLLEGKADMTIPPGTQPGDHFRLKGQGLSDGRQQGDLIVTLQVTIPRQLSEEERRLFEQLRAAGIRSSAEAERS